MKTLIAAAVRCYLMLLVPNITYAISAQWDLDPISGDWNTAANWTPMVVPDGPADIATFGLSNTTDVSISADTEVNEIRFTSAATNPYSITIGAGLTLTLSGVGITNNSGIIQSFIVRGFPEGGQMHFTNSTSAGNARIFLESGSLQFSNRSSAASASIDVSVGEVSFFNRSSAGGATFTTTFTSEVGSTINFFNLSSAGSATFTSEGGSTINFFNRSSAGSANVNVFVPGESINFFDASTASTANIGGSLQNTISFHDRSTAGSASLNLGEDSDIYFFDHSSAGNATISGGASTFIFGEADIWFNDSSTAGNASITGYGTQIFFTGFSTGETAAIGLFFNGGFETYSSLGIDHNVTIGSLEGDEPNFVFLGANNLTIGSNNRSTTFAGMIVDGGFGGSLTKIGNGTLTLTGVSTYTGNTNINRGVLQVDGSITSNTFVNHSGTLAGTGTINGNLANNGRVSPGSASAPGVLTVTGNYTQAQYAALMIQIAGTNTGDFSVLNVLGNANLNGLLDPVLLNGFVPTIGDSYIFLNYASLTGAFSHIQHQVFDNGMLEWSVTYELNHAILTVEQHTPDQGSTFLLLTLGLLGLATYQRHCRQS
jgi:autotransporter-associated beta strand protein